MLAYFHDMKGKKIFAKDDDFGSLVDVYVDRRNWSIRYYVVDTQRWLPSPVVLVAPSSVVGMVEDSIQVSLTQSEIQKAMPKETHQPPSLRYEVAVYEHYGWAPYGDMPFASPHSLASPYPFEPVAVPPEQESLGEVAKDEEDDQLVSLANMTGYRIHTYDDVFGRVKDFVLDTREQQLVDFVMDTHRWLPGGHVTLCPVAEIVRLNEGSRKVEASTSRQSIDHAPDIPEGPLTPEFHRAICRHYHTKDRYESSLDQHT